jgi:hypothetical protein
VKPVNPRRQGSHGFKSLQIIYKHPGISVQVFVEAGGRLKDLNWDLKYGNAELR